MLTELETNIMDLQDAAPGEAGKMLGVLSTGQAKLFDVSDLGRGLGILEITASSYALQLTDLRKTIVRTASGGGSVVLPLDSALAWPVGEYFNMARGASAGNFDISYQSGVTLYSGGAQRRRLRTQTSFVRVEKIGPNIWAANGDIVSIT